MSDLSYLQHKLKKKMNQNKFNILPDKSKILFICAFIIIFIIKELKSSQKSYSENPFDSDNNSSYSEKSGISKLFSSLGNKFNNLMHFNTSDNLMESDENNNKKSKIIKKLLENNKEKDEKIKNIFEYMNNFDKDLKNLHENLYSKNFKNYIQSKKPSLYDKPNLFLNPDNFNKEYIQYVHNNDFILKNPKLSNQIIHPQLFKNSDKSSISSSSSTSSTISSISTNSSNTSLTINKNVPYHNHYFNNYNLNHHQIPYQNQSIFYENHQLPYQNQQMPYQNHQYNYYQNPKNHQNYPNGN